MKSINFMILIKFRIRIENAVMQNELQFCYVFGG